MDVDFSLILVILCGFTGLVTLLDCWVFKPMRKRVVANYCDKNAGKVDEVVVKALAKEPVWIEYPKSFFPVLLIVLLLRSFLVEPFKIPSGSMLPTLEIGDFILVNKYIYGLRLPVLGTKLLSVSDPKRGDVMVFKYPESPRINYIKRVVGVPGDEISYYNKQLKINGEPVSTELIAQLPPQRPLFNLLTEQLGQAQYQVRNSLRGSLAPGQWRVPDGHYFVLGDNRDNSRDSRIWGFVPDQLVVGKAFAIWMSLPGWIPSFGRNGLIQ